VAFAVALAVLIRAGFGLLTTAVGYVLGGAAGGALLYVIMVYAVAPALNTNISDFTPRAPFSSPTWSMVRPWQPSCTGAATPVSCRHRARWPPGLCSPAENEQ
jgi:hypothetical protein